MIKTNIVQLLKDWKLGYPLDTFLKIGDSTALRYEKGVAFRRNFERGILLCAVADRFALTKFVDIGTGRGYSAACVSLCKTVDTIITIDSVSTKVAIENIDSLKLPTSQKIIFVHNDTKQCKDELNIPFDFAFIDGEHTYKGVKRDFELVRNIAKVVVFDDYRKKHNGVKKYIKEQSKIVPGTWMLIYTDGWLFHNQFITQHGDADRVQDGKEFDSGQVIWIKN